MKRWGTFAGILLVLGALGYGAYVQVWKWHEQAVKESVDKKGAAWQRESERLQKEIRELREELANRQEEATLPEEKLQEVFGEDAAGRVGERAESEREVTDRKVREFFAYLDGKDYIKAYRLEGGTGEAFRGIVERLAQHPPVVSAELKDPFLLIRNLAHFYRVMGKRDLGWVRDVMVNESEIAEPLGALFYEWALPEADGREATDGRPPLNTLYEYAAFLLNTVGGRSYLLRRDSKIRILTTYYCVLIVDRANEEQMNRHGIDIRPHIASVAEEIRHQRGLVYQKKYMDALEGLQKRYAR